MAHFAELDQENKVLRVIVVNNDVLLDENGIEREEKGILFCQSLFGGNWVQTSYSNKFRKHYAGIDFTYDKEKDIFIPPKPFNSWILNEDDYVWEAPIKPPNDEFFYRWDEETQQWIKQDNIY